MLKPSPAPLRYACRGTDGRFLPPFPFNPVQLTQETRGVVGKEINGQPCRKYTEFYAVGVYGGIATAYSVGCNFRCIFCWVDWSRDWPELYGEFYTPAQVYNNLRRIMNIKGLRRARISGAEPTLCPDHLCGVLDLVNKERGQFNLFVIESNGIVLSQEKSLAPRLAQYASSDPADQTVGHVRLSLRGGLPEPFEAKTGCSREFLDLPFIAAQRLWDAGVSFHMAVVVDPRFTSPEEKAATYARLAAIDPSVRNSVEEEFLDPYPHALVRLRAAQREDVAGKIMSNKERIALRGRPSL